MRSELIRTDVPFGDPRRAVGRVSAVARVARVLDYLFGILYALLLIRFALELFGARQGAGFYQIIRALTDVFYAPFRGLFAATPVETGHLEWPLLVAVLSYMVLHAGIRGLLRLVARG